MADLYRNFANKIEKSAAAYSQLDASAAASPSGSRAIGTILGRIDGSRDSAPLAAFNAMLLVAIKLLGGNSSLTAKPSTSTSDVATVPSVAVSGKRRDSQPA